MSTGGSSQARLARTHAVLSGRCSCNAVEDAFLHAGYCHCSRCRASSGAAFTAFVGIEKEAGRFLHVTMGTLADDPAIRPMFHIFVGSKAPWHEPADALPQYPGCPPAQALGM